MNIDIELKERADKANSIIEKYLPAEEGYQKKVIEAMNYSVLAGGKRLRPVMMHAIYKMFAHQYKEAMIEPFMAAIEMIHTYSLVHDDLPAMDNDEYRRGKLTTHARYGEDIGILAGDGLLNYAFETALKAFDEEIIENETDYKRIAKALKVMFSKSGIYGMIGGQTLDVISSGENLNKDELDFIFKMKTSALIEASMMTGAILAGADEETIEKIREAAVLIGVAFQIQDDILDVTGSFEEIGKPVLSDEKNEKTTFVSLYGLEESKKIVNEMSNNAVMVIRTIESAVLSEKEFMEELIISLINRRS